MGVTVHYRGRLADPELLEPLEDLLIDLVLELGGEVDIWRSAADHDPRRMVRGLLVNVEPGQETLSLLIAPDGWITPLHAIEQAERQDADEGPWCFVKTQFGSPVGHAALVELLAVVRDHFIPDLEVSDESGYWEHRDAAKLAETIDRNARAIEAFTEALGNTSLSPEAREDPQIVAARVERVARLVRESFNRSERDDAAGAGGEPPQEWPEVEARWQSLHRESEARARRMQRRIEERLLSGDPPEEAVEAAHNEEFPADDDLDAGTAAGETTSWLESEEPPDEPWSESSAQDDAFSARPRERDPLLDRATSLYLELVGMAKSDEASAAIDLLRHAGELCGGLSQVLPLPPSYEFDEDARGLAAVQLKRALRGAAFLRGGLINRGAASSGAGASSRMLEEVESLQSEIVDRLKQARPMPEE